MMPGWSSPATALASRTKRVRDSWSSVSERSLSATQRDSSRSQARWTAPMPPDPTAATRTYFPIRAPGTRRRWTTSSGVPEGRRRETRRARSRCSVQRRRRARSTGARTPRRTRDSGLTNSPELFSSSRPLSGMTPDSTPISMDRASLASRRDPRSLSTFIARYRTESSLDRFGFASDLEEVPHFRHDVLGRADVLAQAVGEDFAQAGPDAVEVVADVPLGHVEPLGDLAVGERLVLEVVGLEGLEPGAAALGEKVLLQERDRLGHHFAHPVAVEGLLGSQALGKGIRLRQVVHGHEADAAPALGGGRAPVVFADEVPQDRLEKGPEVPAGGVEFQKEVAFEGPDEEVLGQVPGFLPVAGPGPANEGVDRLPVGLGKAFEVFAAAARLIFPEPRQAAERRQGGFRCRLRCRLVTAAHRTVPV